MARAYGSSAQLLMKRETTYGQAATGNYIRMPFNRCNLGTGGQGQKARRAAGCSTLRKQQRRARKRRVSPHFSVRPDGAVHQWRKDPPR